MTTLLKGGDVRSDTSLYEHLSLQELLNGYRPEVLYDISYWYKPKKYYKRNNTVTKCIS